MKVPWAIDRDVCSPCMRDGPAEVADILLAYIDILRYDAHVHSSVHYLPLYLRLTTVRDAWRYQLARFYFFRVKAIHRSHEMQRSVAGT